MSERLGRTSGTKRSHFHTRLSALNGGQVHGKDGELKTESAAAALSLGALSGFGKIFGLASTSLDLWGFRLYFKSSDNSSVFGDEGVVTPSILLRRQINSFSVTTYTYGINHQPEINITACRRHEASDSHSEEDNTHMVPVKLPGSVSGTPCAQQSSSLQN